MKRKQLLNDLKETRRYRKLKEEALDRILWRTRWERGSNYRKTNEIIIIIIIIIIML